MNESPSSIMSDSDLLTDGPRHSYYDPAELDAVAAASAVYITPASDDDHTTQNAENEAAETLTYYDGASHSYYESEPVGAAPSVRPSSLPPPPDPDQTSFHEALEDDDGVDEPMTPPPPLPDDGNQEPTYPVATASNVATTYTTGEALTYYDDEPHTYYDKEAQQTDDQSETVESRVTFSEETTTINAISPPEEFSEEQTEVVVVDSDPHDAITMDQDVNQPEQPEELTVLHEYNEIKMSGPTTIAVQHVEVSQPTGSDDVRVVGYETSQVVNNNHHQDNNNTFKDVTWTTQEQSTAMTSSHTHASLPGYYARNNNATAMEMTEISPEQVAGTSSASNGTFHEKPRKADEENPTFWFKPTEVTSMSTYFALACVGCIVNIPFGVAALCLVQKGRKASTLKEARKYGHIAVALAVLGLLVTLAVILLALFLGDPPVIAV